ncbi:hypothetical protein QJS04_geneDACA004903 [Acorus gramineus]|uniref:Uncharacterized protein n=1 Tax=Acorus gramineus TaxID=55184 RepID=A0AAV9BUB4_ACOGR|nr:hypothetical protein QJS04_geneDACA004903 [Acorus gramineus]
MAPSDDDRLLHTPRPISAIHLPRKILSLFRPKSSSARRRRKPSIRLGGVRRRRTFRRWGVGFLRRIRLSRILKRLRKAYRAAVADLFEAGASMDVFHSRLMMETYFAVPVSAAGFRFSSAVGYIR